jgi:hypothetical protein
MNTWRLTLAIDQRFGLPRRAVQSVKPLRPAIRALGSYLLAVGRFSVDANRAGAIHLHPEGIALRQYRGCGETLRVMIHA